MTEAPRYILDASVAVKWSLRLRDESHTDTAERVLADVTSGIRFHVETFGPEVLNAEPPVLDVFLAGTTVDVA